MCPSYAQRTDARMDGRSLALYAPASSPHSPPAQSTMTAGPTDNQQTMTKVTDGQVVRPQ